MIVPIKRVFLMLGPKCNLQCKYCLQHDMVDNDSSKVSKDVIEWLKRLIREQKTEPVITFYGGEPLVYWEAIVDVVKQLGECHYSIITNGKLLTEDKVDFINDYKISVAVSWDGINVLDTRGYDVLMSNPELMKIRKLSFSGVLSNLNYPQDFLDGINSFMVTYKTENGHYPRLNIDTIMDFGNCHDLRNVDTDKLEKQMYEIIENPQEKVSYTVFNDAMMRGYTFFMKHEDKKAVCGNGYTVWNIDKEGNLYRCHNCGDKLGTINDNFVDLVARAAKLDPTEYNYISKCKDCPAQPMCRSGCPLIGVTGRREYYCDIRKAFYGPYIEYMNRPTEQGREIIIG